MEQDVGTAGAPGNAERHAVRCRHFLAQRLFDHGACGSLRLRGSREPRLFRWPVGSVDHMPGEEYDPRQSLLRRRHFSRDAERLVDDAERRRHVVRQEAKGLEDLDVPARGKTGEGRSDARKRFPYSFRRAGLSTARNRTSARAIAGRVAFVLLTLKTGSIPRSARAAAIRFAQASRSWSAPHLVEIVEGRFPRSGLAARDRSES